MQNLKSIGQFYMPKLSKKAIRYGRTYGRTDPNYRKATLLKILLIAVLVYLNNKEAMLIINLKRKIRMFYKKILANSCTDIP